MDIEPNHPILQDAFSVLTLNLRFGLADDGSNGWQHRKNLFPSLLEKYQTDLIKRTGKQHERRG